MTIIFDLFNGVQNAKRNWENDSHYLNTLIFEKISSILKNITNKEERI